MTHIQTMYRRKIQLLLFIAHSTLLEGDKNKKTFDELEFQGFNALQTARAPETGRWGRSQSQADSASYTNVEKLFHKLSARRLLKFFSTNCATSTTEITVFTLFSFQLLFDMYSQLSQARCSAVWERPATEPSAAVCWLQLWRHRCVAAALTQGQC